MVVNKEDITMIRKYMIVFIILSFGIIIADEYDYSKEDMNPTSISFGEMVWQPTYIDYITLHYFTTQG